MIQPVEQPVAFSGKTCETATRLRSAKPIEDTNTTSGHNLEKKTDADNQQSAQY